MNQNQRLEKLIEEIQEKVAEGWQVEAVYAFRGTSESGVPCASFQVDLVKEQR